MNPAFSKHLEFLYGSAVAGRVAPEFEALLDAFRLRITRARKPNLVGLSQRDAILITYADQVRAPGLPPLQVLTDFANLHLRNLISGVHLLPFYPWSSDDGFSVKDFFAVDPSFGAWEDVRRLGENFDLMFDAVFNHLSAQSDWFQRFLRDDPDFRDFFVTVEGKPDLSQVVRPRALPLLTEFQTVTGPRKVWTTFSADQVDLNFGNPRVLLATLEALMFYVLQGARFIRLDAIAFLWKEIGTCCLHLPQTHAVIHAMRVVLDEIAPEVQIITETNVPHLDNLSYFGDGTNEAQLVYNFALPPLVLHSLATGNAEKLTRWAQSLRLPSDRTTFFNFLASHDGIGLNPARGILTELEIDALAQRTLAHGGFISYKNMPDGSRVPYEMNINFLDALSAPDANESIALAARKFLTAQAILLSIQGVPGIYFHSLFGSRGDRAGADASGIARRINREKLERTDLEAELGDALTLRSHVWSGMRMLLEVRRAQPAFSPQSGQRVLTAGARLFAVLRTPQEGGKPVLCGQNISPEPIALAGLLADAAPNRGWVDLLTGRRYPASGSVQALNRLDPFQTVWLQPE